MQELREQYLNRCDGDAATAAAELAWNLTLGDPATFKAGYTLDNAAIAAMEVFPDVLPAEIIRLLDERKKREDQTLAS